MIEWVKTRIASAALVVADLSDANPNVYLEVGYAWGCGRPTVLVVRDTSQLKFDVRGQRCLVYKRIKDLEALLRTELENLKLQMTEQAENLKQTRMDLEEAKKEFVRIKVASEDPNQTS